MVSSRKSSGAANKKLPLEKAMPLGIQHVLAMFAGNITVPIIIAGVFGQTPEEKIFLIQMALFVAGVATITEAAGVGAVGALCLALLKKELSWAKTKEVMQGTAKLTSMVFLILIGASVFSLVFRGYEGDELVQSFLLSVPGGVAGVLIVVMLAMFLLGFVLDFIEITFVVVPIVAPAILALGVDPIWLGIMIAVNLQTSFLTPPFGFALFYLRGVAPPEVATKSIYKGVLPFVCIQLLMLLLLALFPELVTWLPAKLYG